MTTMLSSSIVDSYEQCGHLLALMKIRAYESKALQ